MTRLWLRFVLGQPLVQVSCAVVAAGSFAFARLLESGPNDPPKPLVAVMLAIGCFPIIAVGVMRGQKTLRERVKSSTATASTAHVALVLIAPLIAVAGTIALAIA